MKSACTVPEESELTHLLKKGRRLNWISTKNIAREDFGSSAAPALAVA